MINIIAEIGINHNGDIDMAKNLIKIAKQAECNYVKFQKREPEICVPDKQKNKLRNTPWGKMKYIDYKYKIEFNKEQYQIIDKYCKKIGIKWFASVWDKPSVDFMKEFVDIAKIPSALISNHDLVKYARKKFKTLIVSTGMSTEEEIIDMVQVGNPDVIMHTNSTYPSPVEELNLNYITYLREKYPEKSIGYSGHEYGLVTTFAVSVMGVEWIERHITLDRTMWGSDHLASVEPQGLMKLVKETRDIEKSLGDRGPRKLFKSELAKRESLRGN